MVNFYNVNQFVGDLHRGKLNNSATGFYNFYKSHSEVNDNYLHVIHLVRNPEDTLISYYNYFCSRAGYKYEFKKFIHSRRGMKRYIRHVEGWMNCFLDVRYVPISYERLCETPEKFLAKWCNLNGEELQKEKLEKAIKNSSKNSMIEQERVWRGGGRKYEPFVGAKAFRPEHLTCDEKLTIEKKCGPTYERFMEIERYFYDEKL